MIWKFFTKMHVVDSNGMIHKATWREKIIWVKQGCHLRDEKVCRRLFKNETLKEPPIIKFSLFNCSLKILLILCF